MPRAKLVGEAEGRRLGDGTPRAKLGKEADGRRLGDGAPRAKLGKGRMDSGR
jgi:hypothetical protein